VHQDDEATLIWPTDPYQVTNCSSIYSVFNAALYCPQLTHKQGWNRKMSKQSWKLQNLHLN